MILNPNAASVLVVPHGRPAAATNHHGSLPPPPSLPAARLHIPCLWGGGGGSRGITKRVRARISMMMMTVPPPHKIFGATQVTRRQSSLRRATHQHTQPPHQRPVIGLGSSPRRALGQPRWRGCVGRPVGNALSFQPSRQEKGAGGERVVLVERFCATLCCGGVLFAQRTRDAVAFEAEEQTHLVT